MIDGAAGHVILLLDPEGRVMTLERVNSWVAVRAGLETAREPADADRCSTAGADGHVVRPSEAGRHREPVTALAALWLQTNCVTGPGLDRPGRSNRPLEPAVHRSDEPGRSGGAGYGHHAYHGRVADLLLVEDDSLLRDALRRDLSEHGHEVTDVPTALEALRVFNAGAPDLVVLDLNLPDLDGVQTLKMMRAVGQDTPIVIASGRDQEDEIVRLLHDGADDYVVKPFSSAQLHARITAVLRRTRRQKPNLVHRVGDLVVDSVRREVQLAGEPIHLTRREFELLAYLAARPEQVITRRELLSEVWDQAQGHDQTIDVHVSWLRRKLGESAARPRYLHTVRGVGVRLAAPE